MPGLPGRRSESGTQTMVCGFCGRERDRMDTFVNGLCVRRDECERYVKDQRDDLILAANSARVLIERHRATRGGSSLLTTALQELDGVLPTYASGPSEGE